MGGGAEATFSCLLVTPMQPETGPSMPRRAVSQGIGRARAQGGTGSIVCDSGKQETSHAPNMRTDPDDGAFGHGTTTQRAWQRKSILKNQVRSKP